MEPVAASWEDKGFGIQLWAEDDDFLDPTVERIVITHVWWADNLWLLADNWREFQEMAQDTTELMNKLGMRWKPSSMEVVHNRHVHNAEKGRALYVRGSSGGVFTCRQVECLEVLGDRLNARGETAQRITHRERAA